SAERRPLGPGAAARARDALPAGPPGRGDHRRRGGRPSQCGVPASRQSNARPESAAGLAAQPGTKRKAEARCSEAFEEIALTIIVICHWSLVICRNAIGE